MQRISTTPMKSRPAALLSALKWRRGTILAWAMLGFAVGVVVLAIEQRRDVVTGEVLLPSFEGSASAALSTGFRESFVDAQIETIKSDHVIAATLDKLAVSDKIALQDKSDGPIAPSPAMLTSDETISTQQRPRSAANFDAESLQTISKVKDLLTVSPIASGSAVRVALESEDPNSAAKLVNALLDSYIEDYEKRVRDAPKEATRELQQRLDTLQDRAAAAEEQASARSNTVNERQRLEALASTYRTLHQQTLSEYANALNSKPLVSAEPRVLSRASAARTSPASSTATLAGAILGGGLIGLVVAMRREQVLRPVRTPENLEADTGLPILGVVSLVHGRKLFPKNGSEPPLVLHDDRDCLRGVLLRLRESLRDGSCVVGIASTLDGEGKSTLAFNLAVLGVEGDARVLLLDGNLHRPALARGLTGASGTELLSALKDSSNLVRHVVTTEFGFDFLGEQSIADTVRPAVLLASPGLDRLIAGARESYDLIICDLPALANHADAQAAALSLDVCVLVTEWGCTSTAALIRALKASPAVGLRTAGIIINKAPLEVQRSA